MAQIANRRSAMTLFSISTDLYCHIVRLVLAEKGITHDLVAVQPDRLPEDLVDLNPYQSVPTLVDRELVLYNAQVIVEYLDERFPHPPLMPVDPVSRAKSRLMLFRIEEDWFSQVPALESGDSKQVTKARKVLRESLTASTDVFAARPFFLSEEFSLVDCFVVPLLWRLPRYGIELPPSAKPLLDYAERIFERDSFQASLSDAERDMRP